MLRVINRSSDMGSRVRIVKVGYGLKCLGIGQGVTGRGGLLGLKELG